MIYICEYITYTYFYGHELAADAHARCQHRAEPLDARRERVTAAIGKHNCGKEPQNCGGVCLEALTEEMELGSE